jgi:hypothetical protein
MTQPVTGQDDKQIQTIVVRYRNRVVTVNRLITIVGIICCIVAVIFIGWVSIVAIAATSWVLSIINSIRVSNKIRELTGLSHSEQAVIWSKVKTIARKRE